MDSPPQSVANALGKPGEGFHAARLWGYARNDLLGTIAIAIVISFASGMGILRALLGTFAIAIIAHAMFGVRSTMTRQLGLVR